jgi:hypothetical protein
MYFIGEIAKYFGAVRGSASNMDFVERYSVLQYSILEENEGIVET